MRFSLCLGHECLRLLRLKKQDAAALVEGLAHVGDPEPAAGSLDQSHTQAPLQLRDAAAELGFGLPQRPAGRRKPPMPNHFSKVGIVVQVRTDHRSSYGTLCATNADYTHQRSEGISLRNSKTLLIWRKTMTGRFN